MRKVLLDCLYCKRKRMKPQKAFMSELPKERLDAYEKPFCNTGIEFFGPVIVKLSKKTLANQAKAKRYGVIFTCTTTRAIHLKINLVPSASFCYKRNAKKRPWNTSNT